MPVSFRLEHTVFDKLNQFCEDSGQAKTVAIERALGMYIDDYYEKQGGFELSLTLDGIEYFDNPKPSESSGKPVIQQNTYNNCNIQEIIGNNNTVIQKNQQNDIKQLRDLISDFLNTQNINNDDLKDELQSIVEDIDEGKIGEKQAGRWWNRLSKISDVVTIGTTACNLLPMAQENLPAILDFIRHIMHT